MDRGVEEESYGLVSALVLCQQTQAQPQGYIDAVQFFLGERSPAA